MSQAMRSRVGIGAMALMGLILSTAAAVAQDRPVTTTKDSASTVKVNVSGDMVLDYVYRSREITAFTDNITNASGVNNSAISEPENTFEGHVAMRIAAELSEKIGAVIEFGTRRIDDDDVNKHSGEGAQVVHLREAHVMLNELFTPELKAQLGMTTWSFNPRGRGGSLAFDPRHAQAINRNFASNYANATGIEAIDERLIGAAFVDELQTMGAVLTYTSGAVMVDLVLLPGVVEGGRPAGDESLYALDLMYNLDNQVSKGSRIGVIGALSAFNPTNGATTHSHVYTVGGGAVLKFMDGALELYGEGYAQFGKLAEQPGGDTDVAGYAVQVGLEYRHTVGNPMPIWAGINFTLISGDGDDAADDEANRFSAYESINDLMILEDPYYGYDWDSNLQIVKVNAGIALSVAGGKDNLEISGIVGFAEAAEVVGDTTLGQTEEDALGTEVDIRLRWILSKQASISLSGAFLTGSDILEEAMGGAAGVQSEDSAYLWVMGVDLRF